METFGEWAPYLKNPLVLGGFICMLIAGIVTYMMKNKLSENLIKYALTGTFGIVLLVIGLGFYSVKKQEQREPLQQTQEKKVIKQNTGDESTVIATGDGATIVINNQ